MSKIVMTMAIEPAMKERLEFYAKREERSVSSLLRRIIAEWERRERRRKHSVDLRLRDLPQHDLESLGQHLERVVAKREAT